MERAEILANGLVQGVGLRYFIQRHAKNLGICGYVENLYSGEVLTVVEGDRFQIEELYNQIRSGSPYSRVKNAFIKWSQTKNEFTKFEIKY
jgi:acylphosphatase